MKRLKFYRSKYFYRKKTFVLLLSICLGVGFAFLSTQLNITGNTSVKGNRWSVYFDNVQVSDGSVDANTPIIDANKTTVNYSVAFEQPGDYYEFTVDAVNDGTIDAMIDTVTKTNLTSDTLNYFNYSITYEDGSEIKKNDVLEANDMITYKISLIYRKDIEAEILPEDTINLNLTFSVNYIKSNIITKKDSNFIALIKNQAQSDSEIDFSSGSSSTNGLGIYIKSGTENNSYPIYYYRGAVENNNAIFAGYCWKVVRTTETGGTKLIYNGSPNGSGGCTNSTGTATQVGTSSFNPSTEFAYLGYMYGEVYPRSDGSVSSSYLYGKSFSYDNGMYTLVDTTNNTDDISNHHYTCFNTSGQCSELKYIYYIFSSTAKYTTLKDGKSIEDAIAEMQENKNDSSIKKVVDNWFEQSLIPWFTNQNKAYLDYIEDTVWCNDRSFLSNGTAKSDNGWISNGGDPSKALYFSAAEGYKLGNNSVKVNLTCSNKNDAFTVKQKNGNGVLKYPVGLLTSDELVLAGSQYSTGSSYLYTNQNWWTMTPYIYNGYHSCNFRLLNNRWLMTAGVDNTSGVRPAISLKPEVLIKEGTDGSSTKPYEFVVE